MKKLLINLFLIFGVLAIAQNKRFIYEYKFISDSTNVDDVKTEMMFLDTTKDGSKYYSYTVFNSDSIMKVDLEKQLAATGSAGPGEGQKPDSNQIVAAQKPIKLGKIVGNDQEILEGLSASDRIAISGILELQNCTAIEPVTQTAQAPQP